MTLPLIMNLMQRKMTTEEVMEQFKGAFLREFPEIRTQDLQLYPVAYDQHEGQFNVQVNLHDMLGTAFNITILSDIQQKRKLLYTHQFDQMDRSNDYTFRAYVNKANIWSVGPQTFHGEKATSPMEAVTDLIYHSYYQKPEFKPLALHEKINRTRADNEPDIALNNGQDNVPQNDPQNQAQSQQKGSFGGPRIEKVGHDSSNSGEEGIIMTVLRRIFG